MDIIIGGCFQGKLDYAKNKYNLNISDINDLTKEELDLSKKCLYHFEYFAYNASKNTLDTIEEIKRIESLLKNKIIIIDDIFEGVVPIDKEIRKYREEAAKLSAYLVKKSDTAVRIYLGIEEKLK